MATYLPFHLLSINSFAKLGRLPRDVSFVILSPMRTSLGRKLGWV
jgi:hypothetical protein